MFEKFKTFWRYIRRLAGDDAYDQYLKHFAENHPKPEDSSEEIHAPLTREAFFKEWQENKWKGVKRCC